MLCEGGDLAPLSTSLSASRARLSAGTRFEQLLCAPLKCRTKRFLLNRVAVLAPRYYSELSDYIAHREVHVYLQKSLCGDGDRTRSHFVEFLIEVATSGSREGLNL